MVHKELEMFFIAYNLIRALIVQAGATYLSQELDELTDNFLL